MCVWRYKNSRDHRCSLQQCFQAYIHYSREQQLLSPQGACSVHMERRGKPQCIFHLAPSNGRYAQMETERYLVTAFICWILVNTYPWCTTELHKNQAGKLTLLILEAVYVWGMQCGRGRKVLCAVKQLPAVLQCSGAVLSDLWPNCHE